jgi:hypothetical protein
MPEIANLVAVFEADTRHFDRGTAKAERGLNRVANAAKRSGTAVSAFETRTRAVGAGLASLRNVLAATGFVAAGTAIIKAAMNVEEARNKFTALEGSVEKANARIQKLIVLSRQNVGVNLDSAMDNYARLSAIGGVTEQSIEKTIKALGRLDIAFQIDSQAGFLRNMEQIFTQGFEMPDIKEAIGRVPIFEQLVKQAFGTSDTKALKALKESGTITLESWMAGFAEAVNNDARLKGLTETFGSKLSKAMSEINIAIAPFGQQLIDQIRPELDKAITALQQGDYATVGDVIGVNIGRAIGVSLKGALSAEMAGTAQTGFFDSIGRGIQEGMNADSATTAVKMFFNKVGAEVAQGIVDLAALAYSLPTALPGKLADTILESMGFTVDETNSPHKKMLSHLREAAEEVKVQYERNAIEILQASKASWAKVAGDLYRIVRPE